MVVVLFFQNLELPSVAQNHATLLLDAALDRCSWDLARELVRFLRTIGNFNLNLFGLQRRCSFWSTRLTILSSRIGIHPPLNWMKIAKKDLIFLEAKLN
jgi:hypothetical protein